MRSIVIDDLSKFLSFIMAVCLFFFEMMYPFFIWRIATKVVRLNKGIEEYEEKAEKDSKYKGKLEKRKKYKDEFDKKFGFFYELFREDTKICAGYFLVIAIRKLIFAFNLVLFNNFPAFNLVIFILCSLSMIGMNFFQKPYKDKVMNYFNVFSELIYIVFYCSSFPLIGEGVDESKRKSITTLMLVCFLTLFTLELLLVVYENMKSLSGVCSSAYTWTKDKIDKRKQK